jgi:hypothetical protein
MALLYPLRPRVFNNKRLLPANVYGMPALSPFYQGLRGFAQARQTSTKSFENTLRQFATTPFAVNSEAYMDRIRTQYGYQDKDIQNALGVVGGVVGAGVSGLVELGYFQSPIKSFSFRKGFKLQNPFKGPQKFGQKIDWSKTITDQRRNLVQKLFFKTDAQNKAIKNFNTLNDVLTNSKSAVKKSEEALKMRLILDWLQRVLVNSRRELFTNVSNEKLNTFLADYNSLTVMNLIWDVMSDVLVTSIGLFYFSEKLTKLKKLGVMLSFISIILLTWNDGNE